MHDNVKRQIVANTERDTELIFRTFHNTARVAKNSVSEEIVEIAPRAGATFADVADLASGARGRERVLDRRRHGGRRLVGRPGPGPDRRDRQLSRGDRHDPRRGRADHRHAASVVPVLSPDREGDRPVPADRMRPTEESADLIALTRTIVDKELRPEVDEAADDIGPDDQGDAGLGKDLPLRNLPARLSSSVGCRLRGLKHTMAPARTRARTSCSWPSRVLGEEGSRCPGLAQVGSEDQGSGVVRRRTDSGCMSAQ